MNILAESMIIYRSVWEAERDQFFFDNPEYILYFVVGIVLGVSVFIIGSKIYDKWRRNR